MAAPIAVAAAAVGIAPASSTISPRRLRELKLCPIVTTWPQPVRDDQHRAGRALDLDRAITMAKRRLAHAAAVAMNSRAPPWSRSVFV